MQKLSKQNVTPQKFLEWNRWRKETHKVDLAVALGQLYELNIDSSQSVFICSIPIGFIDEFCKLLFGKLKRFVEIACVWEIQHPPWRHTWSQIFVSEHRSSADSVLYYQALGDGNGLEQWGRILGLGSGLLLWQMASSPASGSLSSEQADVVLWKPKLSRMMTGTQTCIDMIIGLWAISRQKEMSRRMQDLGSKLPFSFPALSIPLLSFSRYAPEESQFCFRIQNEAAKNIFELNFFCQKIRWAFAQSVKTPTADTERVESIAILP